MTARTNLSTTQLATAVTNTSANSVYPDPASYWRRVLTTDGFAVNGLLTGIRIGTVHTQRLQDEATYTTYSRYWINGSSAWSAWIIYLDAADYDAKGDILVGTANDTYTRQPVGTDGQVLTADSTLTSGIKWATPAAGGAAVSGWDAQEVRATDWTNATTTITDIFAGFTPAINSNYEIEVHMSVVSGTTAANLQFTITGAATSLATWAVMQINPTAAGATAFVNPATWGGFGAATAGMTTGMVHSGRALVRTNATAATTPIKVQGRSSGTVQITVRAGSYMRWRKY